MYIIKRATGLMVEINNVLLYYSIKIEMITRNTLRPSAFKKESILTKYFLDSLTFRVQTRHCFQTRDTALI